MLFCMFFFACFFPISFISSFKLRTPSVSPHSPEREVVVTQPPSSAAGGGRILFIHEGFPAIWWRTITRWWFQTCLFSPLLGEMIQFDEHIFSDGLKQPTNQLDNHRKWDILYLPHLKFNIADFTPEKWVVGLAILFVLGPGNFSGANC